MQELLDRWKIKIDYNLILSMWNESHRHFHNQSHLMDLIDQINSDKNKNLLFQKEYEMLILCALFHDCIYDPIKNDNEEKSAQFFLSLCEEKNKSILIISDAILDTKDHGSRTDLSKKFNKYDMSVLSRDFDGLLEWENGIYQEYKIFGDKLYKKGRLDFLENHLDNDMSNIDNIQKLIHWIKENYNG